MANTDVCTAQLHTWQQKGPNIFLLNLRRAYLKVHVHETLWPFHPMKIDGKRYGLTSLGFGLNVAPLIMKVIISMVLLQEEAVGSVASAYINDIYVNKDVMPVTCVREHMAQFGLVYKDPEWLVDRTQVLGLAVVMEHCSIHSQCHHATVFLSGRLVERASLVTKGWDDETKELSSSVWYLRPWILCSGMIQPMRIGVWTTGSWTCQFLSDQSSFGEIWQGWRVLEGCNQKMTPNISTKLK